MISLDADIVPGRSIGGISLGDRASDVVERIEGKFDVEVFDFENFGFKYMSYMIGGGAISFSADEAGNIVCLCCEPPYKGLFDRRFYPGITAGELSEVSRRQVIVDGYLVVDNNYSIYYGMPDDIDDFNHFSDLGDTVVFNQLYVGNLA